MGITYVNQKRMYLPSEVILNHSRSSMKIFKLLYRTEFNIYKQHPLSSFPSLCGKSFLHFAELIAGVTGGGVYICKSIVNYLRHGNFIKFALKLREL